MHIRCDGVGPSTVVLIAGFGSTSASWDAIVPTLTARTRVCAYDRPRLGSGEPATLANQTFTDQAAHLHELLASVGEPGPYVVVGHSFGGVAAVEFAERYVGDVAALVLVDTSPSDWPTQLCTVADDGTPAATALHEMCASWSHPSAGAELLDVFAAFDDASMPPSLGSLPLTVLTAAERELPFGLAEAELARLTNAWNDGQVRWARMSTDSELISVADTSHFVQTDRPTVVIDAITRRLPSI